MLENVDSMLDGSDSVLDDIAVLDSVEDCRFEGPFGKFVTEGELLENV